MLPTEASELLADLHAGHTSRNREFQRFGEPGARRVLEGYRRLRSLLAELRRPGVEARLRRSRQSGEPALELLIRSVRYHRVTLLSPWEFEFLRSELGAGGLLPDEA